MSLGITAADFTAISAEAAVSVTYYSVTRVVHPTTGDETVTYGSGTSKSWIVWKHGSKFDLLKMGIVDTGDAYAMLSTSDSLSYGDRITLDGETFEFTPACVKAPRFAGPVQLFSYYTLKKVA